MFFAQFSVTLVPIVVMILIAMVSLVVVFRYAQIWIQAYVSGIPLSLFEILGMQLRRVNAKTVVQSLIMAKQSGVVVSCTDMEKAYLQGVDLEKLTLAIIEAKRRGIETTFEELVDAARHDRLMEKLKMREDG